MTRKASQIIPESKVRDSIVIEIDAEHRAAGNRLVRRRVHDRGMRNLSYRDGARGVCQHSLLQPRQALT